MKNDQAIFDLSKGLYAIILLRDRKDLPEELAENLKETELLLRGFIHQLEEEYETSETSSDNDTQG